MWNIYEFRTTSFEFVFRSYWFLICSWDPLSGHDMSEYMFQLVRCHQHAVMSPLRLIQLHIKKVTLVQFKHRKQFLVHMLFPGETSCASPAAQRLPVLRGLQHFVNYITLCGCFDCLILMRMCLLWRYIKAICLIQIPKVTSCIWMRLRGTG